MSVCECVSENKHWISHSQKGECRCSTALQRDRGQQDLRRVEGETKRPDSDGDVQLSVGMLFFPLTLTLLFQVKKERQWDYSTRL